MPHLANSVDGYYREPSNENPVSNEGIEPLEDRAARVPDRLSQLGMEVDDEARRWIERNPESIGLSEDDLLTKE